MIVTRIVTQSRAPTDSAGRVVRLDQWDRDPVDQGRGGADLSAGVHPHFAGVGEVVLGAELGGRDLDQDADLLAVERGANREDARAEALEGADDAAVAEARSS